MSYIKVQYLLALFITLLIFSGCITTTQDDFSAGSYVDITGKISNTPWQHMVNPPMSHPHAEYMDFDDGGQVVVYSKEIIDCDGKLTVKGEVIEIEGTSKRPGSEEVYTELQLVADKVDCLDNQ